MKSGSMLRLGYGLALLLSAGALAACAGLPAAGAGAEKVPVAEQSQPAYPPTIILEARPSAGPLPADQPAAASLPFPGLAAGPGGQPRFQYLPEESLRPMEALLAEISREAAGKIYYGLKDDEEKFLSSRVAVVAAVPLSDLKRDSEFGRVMAEYLLTDLADRGLRVTELRLGRDIHILPQTGEFILSRNIGELANHAQELDYVVVSTYSNTRRTLMLHGRLIDLKTGLIRTSWRHNLPLNRELQGLFQEAGAPFTISVRGVL